MKARRVPAGILRRGERGGGTRQVRFAGHDDDDDDDEFDFGGVPAAPSPLATPTLHSSGRGGPQGPQKDPPFDAPRAAASLLGSSFAARSAVGGAASGAMNVPPTQRLFRGLISLAVPPPPPPPNPRRGVPRPPTTPPQVPGPELGVLMGGVKRGVGVPWLPPPNSQPPPETPRALPSPPGAAFAMFGKLQQWGGG